MTNVSTAALRAAIDDAYGDDEERMPPDFEGDEYPEFDLD